MQSQAAEPPDSTPLKVHVQLWRVYKGSQTPFQHNRVLRKYSLGTAQTCPVPTPVDQNREQTTFPECIYGSSSKLHSRECHTFQSDRLNPNDALAEHCGEGIRWLLPTCGRRGNTGQCVSPVVSPSWIGEPPLPLWPSLQEHLKPGQSSKPWVLSPWLPLYIYNYYFCYYLFSPWQPWGFCQDTRQKVYYCCGHASDQHFARLEQHIWSNSPL